MENEILEYIHRRWGPNEYTNKTILNYFWAGNCFQFALILHNRFPQTKIGFFKTPYNKNYSAHFVVFDNKYYYDWNGIYSPKEEDGDFIDWLSYKAQKFDEAILLQEELWG